MRSQVLSRVAAWLLLGAIGVFTLSPIEMRPVTEAPVSLERLGAFALIGAAFCHAYPKHRHVILILIIGLAGCLEIAQNYVPGRHGRFSDGLVKALGAFLGAAFTALVERRERTK